MNRNSQPPSSDAPERPIGETPQPEQPSQAPPGGYAPRPGYAPPPQGYAQRGYPPPGYSPSGAPPGQPQGQGYPPPGYYPPPGTPPGTPQGYPPSAYSQQQAQKSGIPAWAWVIIGMVLVIVIGCVGVIAALGYGVSQVSKNFSAIGAGLLESFEPVTVAYEFYTDLEAGDYNGAHDLLSPDLAFRYTAADLQTRWQALESAQGKMIPGFPTIAGNPGRAKDGDSVAVNAALSSANGKIYNIALKVQKSGDTWLIQDAGPDLIPEP